MTPAGDSRPLAFVDLDDTLFQTERKDDTARVLGAVDRDGRPLSFMSQTQCALLDWLVASTRLIPTTGRSSDAVDRVRLGRADGAPWRALGVEAVICSFGGVIRSVDGRVDSDWHDVMAAAAGEAAPALADLDARAGAMIDRHGLDIRHRVIVDADLPLYVSVKHNARDGAALARFAEGLSSQVPAGWQTHLNANNLAYMPPFLAKERAVVWYRRTRAGAHPFAIAIGDSLSDLGFLAACDLAAIPPASQLMQHLMRGTAER